MMIRSDRWGFPGIHKKRFLIVQMFNIYSMFYLFKWPIFQLETLVPLFCFSVKPFFHYMHLFYCQYTILHFPKIFNANISFVNSGFVFNGIFFVVFSFIIDCSIDYWAFSVWERKLSTACTKSNMTGWS